MIIKLEKHFFTSKEKLILETDQLKASLFKYDSDIEAIRLENEAGYIVVLPYKGQMIWDAVFYNNSIKMNTPFPEPVKSNNFGETYGCYLMHCGMTAMGVPKESDNHPPHGVIPYADYKDAKIIVGSDNNGNFIAVTGTYEHNVAFDEHYLAQPMVKMYESSGMLDVTMQTKNLSRKEMSLMYLCHVNNKLVPNANIYQSLAWDADHMAIQEVDQSASDSNLIELFNRVKADPSTSNPIPEQEYYDPEIVFFLRDMKIDEDDHAHFLYELPDGSAYYTYFDTKELGHGVRWIAYHEDCEAMGMVLPATAESEGYTAEMDKGNVFTIAPGETFSATVNCGAITQDEKEKIKEKIEKINRN